MHIWGSIRPITLIWASLERSFPPAKVEYRWFQFWSKMMTSDVEEGPRFVTGGYGRHRSQWFKYILTLQFTSLREPRLLCLTKHCCVRLFAPVFMFLCFNLVRWNKSAISLFVSYTWILSLKMGTRLHALPSVRSNYLPGAGVLWSSYKTK